MAMQISRTTFAAGARCLALLSLTLGAASVCSASIIYNVNLTIGAGSMTGFIETDGTVGPILQGADPFLDWNLLLTDGAATFDLLGPLSGANSTVNIEDLFAHGNLSATATQLLYNFGASGSGGSSLLEFYETANPNTFVCISTGACVASGDPNGEGLIISGSATQFTGLSGTQVIGTASTPEPSTGVFVGAGIALLFAGFRKGFGASANRPA